jgi:hypothetical protein
MNFLMLCFCRLLVISYNYIIYDKHDLLSDNNNGEYR